MKKLFRFIFLFLLLLLLVVVGICTYRTFTTDSLQMEFAPATRIEVSDSWVNKLSAGIQVPSISNTTDSVFAALDSVLQRSFPLVDSLLDREKVNDFSYIYHWKGRENALLPILLCAHTDVVPIGDKAAKSWDFPPFSGHIENGFLYGRGTLDDKVDVFGILSAVEMLLTEGYQPERDVYLAFGHDEEIGGNNGAVTIAKLFADRQQSFEYILDEGQVIVREALPGLSAPLAMIGIGEKGYTTLTLTASLEDGGHSSMPPAETAVGILSRAIVSLQDSPFPAKVDGATARFFDYIAPEMDLLQRVVFSNRWLTAPLILNQLENDPTASALVRTTTAPTMLRGGVKDNVLPRRASAKVNFRILPGETVETVIQTLKKKINDDRILISESNADFSENPSPLSPIDRFGFEIIQRSIKEIFPEVIVAPSLVIAGTDARHYTELSEQVYRFSPLYVNRSDLKRIHGRNERISLDNYRQVIRFYRQLLLNSTR